MIGKLPVGERLPTLSGEAVVEEWLAEGGQGDVYRVKYNGQDKALKWYKPGGMGKNPSAFYENLKSNVLKGSPSPTFLWPLDITDPDPDSGVFGYVMDLRPEGYREVSEFMLTKVRFSSYRAVVDASMKIVSAYRILHNKGFSYQDLNDGNFFIHPETGDVRIGDNDNVAPNGKETGIIGKPRYMAPEVVTGQNMPDTLSDLHSMSVILFILFFLTHPLEGKRFLTPALTPKLQGILYGTDPWFIMDQECQENGPDPVIHRNVLAVWPQLPDYMQKLFSWAFSRQSLKNPNTRPTELDWLNELVRFRSEIVRCSCGNNIFYQPGKPCEKCGKLIRIPYQLKLSDYSIPAVAGGRLFRCQMGPCNADSALELVGRIVAKKADVVIYGLQNIGEGGWNAETPSGKMLKVKPGETIPLKNGIKCSITTAVGTETIEIIETA